MKSLNDAALSSRKRRQPSPITLADRARDAGEWEEAARLYRAVLERNPKNAPIWVQYGHVLKGSGRLREAEAAYRRALEGEDAGADTHLQLGHVLKLQGRSEAAGAAYLRALALEPDCRDARRELGALGWDDARLSAVEETLRAGAGDPASSSDRPTRITLADRARDVGQWELAARLYRDALDRNPHNPPIWVQYGHVLKEVGELARAESAYWRAIADDPDATDAHFQLGHVLNLQGKIEEAQAAHLRAITLQPSSSDSLRELSTLGWSTANLNELERLVDPSFLEPVEQKGENEDFSSLKICNDRKSRATALLYEDVKREQKIGIAVSDKQIQFIRDSGLFDESYYRSNNLGVPLGIDPIRHFIERGAREGRWPNRMFDSQFYLSEYPDVAESGTNPLTDFLMHGVAERRRPHPRFFISSYLARYPDVAESGVNPLLHYLSCGEQEGRNASEFDYQDWCKLHGTVSVYDRAHIRARLTLLNYQPLISIIMDVCRVPAELVRRTLVSVERQLYPTWELCVAKGPARDSEIAQLLDKWPGAADRIRQIETPLGRQSSDGSPLVLEAVRGDFVCLVRGGDELSETALYHVVEELNQYPDADILFSDEDKIDGNDRRYQPCFKSDWNKDLFYSFDYLGDFIAYRATILEEIRESRGVEPFLAGAERYDLLLRIIERSSAERIRHMPFVLYHCRPEQALGSTLPRAKSLYANASRHALSAHFCRMGQQAVEVLPGRSTEHNHIVWPISRPEPLISFVIPTAGTKVDLLRNAVSGVLQGTDYPNLEIILLYNGNPGHETLEYLEEISIDPRVQIIEWQHDFNFSRICNLGVAHARGEIICLLNDDVQVIEPNWLREMVGHAVRPEVGIVGAMLYYPDNTIQHAGVILGLGDIEGTAAHIHRRLPRGSSGYFSRAAVTQDLSCVTAACLLVRRRIYCEVGGLDENLAVDFNDVDFCIKVRSKGYLVVWTPFAELYHLESATRGQHDMPEKKVQLARDIRYVHGKWGRAVFDRDPYFNPNLKRHAESYELAEVPRVRKPWLNADEV